jgi:putative ABC transport system permease protein
MLPSLREHHAHPGIFALATLTLALGIGGATTMYSTLAGAGAGVARIPNQDRIGRVFASNPAVGVSRGTVSLDEYAAIRDAVPAFDGIAAFSSTSMLLQEQGGERSIEVMRITPNFIGTLGLPLVAGRELRGDEAQPGAAAVAVVSERFGRARWGAADRAVGQRVTLGGSDAVVVGVLSDSSWFPSRGGEIWMPLVLRDAAAGNTGSVYLVGRLKRGEHWDRVRAQLSVVGRRLGEMRPDARRGWSLSVVALDEDAAKRARFGLLGLLGPAMVVLLIACCNVANLLLARGARRERELAVRSALGATRWTLVRERLAEAGWISATAGAIGLTLAYWGVRGVHAWIDSHKPGVADGIRLDGAALVFALTVVAVAPLLIGLAPAVTSARHPVSLRLRDDARQRRARRGPYGGRDLLVVLEMALAVALVLSAGMLGAFMWEMNRIEMHFDASRVVTASLDLSGQAARAGRAPTLVSRVLEAVRAIPGVKAAAVGEAPFPMGVRQVQIAVEGCAGSSVPSLAPTLAVGTGYFDAVGLPLLQGRAIDDTDVPGAPASAVISEWLSMRCWPAHSAVGRRIRTGSSQSWVTIVGVVPDAMTSQVLANLMPRPPIYLAASQQPGQADTLVVRVETSAASVAGAMRTAIRAIDSRQSLADLSTVDVATVSRFAEGWLTIGLMDAFAVLALALAAIGVFSVTSYWVAERTHEFGVRIAVGASAASILRLVMGRALKVAGIGAAAAALLTMALTRVMWSELIAVGARSPAGFVAIASLLSLVMVGACLLPARRATRVDPVVALRSE